MTADHDQLRELLGAYVLGGLDPEDRARLDTHLHDCARCRTELATYAGLPGLLRAAGAADVLAVDETPPQATDGASLGRALDAARAARRRRRRQFAAFSAVAAVALVFLGALTAVLATKDTVGAKTPSARAGVPLVAVSGTARGQSQLEAKPWGTAVTLDVSGLPAGERFVAWVVADDGSRQQAATWASTPDGHALVTGASALDLRRVASLRVTTADGTMLLSVDV